ncbi:AAA-like domain-containing protein [Okeania sp. KiyG1]|uniref:WD40 domain-containing protein n=1 Tax=Okeania sp. KiyG1 TaxID=2720165 RepID=UPI001921B40E|nr:AAA-like domain-containing protein [Okeania sp. KiyG1]GGA32760.1 hypothetical protein CYANOKiyG1_49620 [Okeania sp. KiyG1]
MMYQIGGSLQDDSPSYVERLADTELYEALKRGEFCYVLNSRQMGKSSLLVRTRHKLQKEGIKCSTVDLTNIGSKHITPTQWYKGVAGELWRGFQLLGKVNLKKWWKEEENISLLQRLSRFICDILLKQFPENNIVIFIDEIDSILSLDFSVDDFFALIRFCYNQRAIDPEYKRITFCIFGVATPSDLIKDKTRTPFNIGRAIELDGFTLEQVQPLAAGLKIGIGDSFEVIKQILYWTNGQPFLSQKLCKLVVEASRDSVSEILTIPPGNEKFWVESIVRTKILHKWESQDEPEHLRTIRDRIQRNEKRAAKLLGIYQAILQRKEIKIDDSREQMELILSGLVVKKDGLLKVKNRIYAEVFNTEWVEKQLNVLRPYSQVLEAWIASNKTDPSRLLRGLALKDAQKWSQGKSLSDIDYEFLAASVEFDKSEIQKALEAEKTKAIEAQLAEEQKRLLQEQKTAKLQRVFLGAVSLALLVVSGLGIITFIQYQRAETREKEAIISEIKALVSSSTGNYNSHQRLDALLSAIKAYNQVQTLGEVDSKLKNQVELVLTKALYGVDEYNRLIGHSAGLWGVAVSPDGEFIASASADRTVKLWNKNGKLLTTFTSHNSGVLGVTFSPDGEIIASSDEQGNILLWYKNGKLLRTLKGHSGAVSRVTFSSDGKIIASASEDKTVKLWNKSGKLLRTLKGHSMKVADVAISSDGEIIASASTDRTVKLWNKNGKLLNTLTGVGVRSVAISPDGDIIAAASKDRTVKLWNKSGKLLNTLTDNDGMIYRLAWSSDGQMLASASIDTTVKIWHRDGRLYRTLRGHSAVVRDIAFSPDGKTIVSASEDKTVKLWKLDNSLYKILTGHEDWVGAVAWSFDGSLLASVSADTTVKLWQTNGKLLRSLEGHQAIVFDVDFSPNNRTLASASADRSVKIWQTNGKLLQTLEKNVVFWGVAFSPDGDKIASALGNNTVNLWQTNGKFLLTLTGHTAEVKDVTWSPNGKIIASTSVDNTVKLWQADGKLLRTLTGHKSTVRGVVFSPDGEIIASAGADNMLKLWQPDGTLLRSFFGHDASIWGVDFSPDGKIIASGSLDKTVKLWNIDGTLLKTLTAHSGGVRGVAFSPDGKILASASSDRTIILWNLDRILQLDKLGYACNWVKDYLQTNQQLEQSDRHLCGDFG